MTFTNHDEIYAQIQKEVNGDSANPIAISQAIVSLAGCLSEVAKVETAARRAYHATLAARMNENDSQTGKAQSAVKAEAMAKADTVRVGDREICAYAEAAEAESEANVIVRQIDALKIAQVAITKSYGGNGY
ncbi:MAG: hypothetical protein WC455_10175 [Dehalococcoidia bacterium]|jgi:hypothetical protein